VCSRSVAASCLRLRSYETLGRLRGQPAHDSSLRRHILAGRSRQWLGAVPAARVRAACQSLPYSGPRLTGALRMARGVGREPAGGAHGRGQMQRRDSRPALSRSPWTQTPDRRQPHRGDRTDGRVRKTGRGERSSGHTIQLSVRIEPQSEMNAPSYVRRATEIAEAGRMAAADRGRALPLGQEPRPRAYSADLGGGSGPRGPTSAAYNSVAIRCAGPMARPALPAGRDRAQKGHGGL
jgi:hypothetical protein